jgi:hypothetical protein
MKTSELTGAALDWAVAKCEELLLSDGGNLQVFGKQLRVHPAKLGTLYTPSTDWEHGGPIIERELIETARGGAYAEHFWKATRNSNTAYGPTPLIAAMRCCVASKLGDTIEVPEVLL